MTHNRHDRGTVEFVPPAEKRGAGQGGTWLGADEREVEIPTRTFRTIALRLGAPGADPCYLVRGESCPQLGAEYIVVQPEVLDRDATRGWLPIGGRHPDTVCLGRSESPELDYGEMVSREHLHIVCATNEIVLIDTSKNGTWLTLDEASCVAAQ